MKNISLPERTVYFRLEEQVRSLTSNPMHCMWWSGFYFQIYAFASSFLLLPLILWHDCPNPVLAKWSRLKEPLWLKVMQFIGIILPRERVWFASVLANQSAIVCDGVGSCNLTTCFRWSWHNFCGLEFSVHRLYLASTCSCVARNHIFMLEPRQIKERFS